MSDNPNNKYYHTKAFKDLNAKWAKKLEKSGFVDIEQPIDFKSGVPDGNLKQWSSTFFVAASRFDPVRYESKEEYYRLAGQFLHDHEFVNETEQLIWTLHCEGVSVDSTVKLLKTKRTRFYSGRKVNRRNIYATIKVLADEMLGKLKP